MSHDDMTHDDSSIGIKIQTVHINLQALHRSVN